MHTPTPEYTENSKLRNNRAFKALMEQAIELSADIKVLDEQLRDIKSQLDDQLKAAAVEGSIGYNGWRVSIIDKAGTPKLNMKKLLNLLGPKGTSLVKQAMTPGTPSHYIQLVGPKKEGEDE